MNTILFDKAPITPSKVVCIGRNYAKHVAELNNEVSDEMVVFMKPNSAISHTLASCHQEALHYEGELSFIVQGGKYVGVGFGLDLTKRNLQNRLKQKGLPWERVKAFDGAAVFDGFVSLPEGSSLKDLSLELYIDDQLTQKGGVSDMLFPPQAILDGLAEFVSLEDGDIVMTGTPEGVGEVRAGAVFTGKVFLGDMLLVESTWTAQ